LGERDHNEEKKQVGRGRGRAYEGRQERKGGAFSGQLDCQRTNGRDEIAIKKKKVTIQGRKARVGQRSISRAHWGEKKADLSLYKRTVTFIWHRKKRMVPQEPIKKKGIEEGRGRTRSL